jgi:tetratricopeptide (TPR) repeat protein
MLGRYDEAIVVAQAAHAVFKASGDDLAAGKIELNMSNLASRQGRFREAVEHCASAVKHFARTGSAMWLAMAENSLANGYMELSELRRAERFYRSALARARGSKLQVTEAEIEASLGRLEMMRGRYSEALRFLERSRVIYEKLAMPHQSAIAEFEIAGAYRELNLLEEAAELYSRSAKTFAKLRMRNEEANNLLQLGRLLSRLQRRQEAVRAFRRSKKLFEREGNVHAVVTVILGLAEAGLGSGDLLNVRALLSECRSLLARDEDPRDGILVDLLSGIADIASGQMVSPHLEKASSTASKYQYRDAVLTAELWKGRGARKANDLRSAERHLRRAAKILSGQRGGLGAEEFSISFLSSRSEVYEELVETLISRGKIEEAFEVLEESRSLSWSRKTDRRRSATSPDTDAELRSKLNFLYQRVDSATDEERGRLIDQVRRAEKELADLDRRRRSLARGNGTSPLRNVVEELKETLPTSTTLVEYTKVGDTFGAFVVAGRHIRYVRLEVTEDRLLQLREALHFQFETFRFSPAHLGKFLDQLRAKILRILAEMYSALIAPLAGHLEGRTLVIAPSGAVNYIPFAALWDGSRHLVERWELRTVPSASVWQHLRKKTQPRGRKAFLIGFADDRIPHVEEEVKAISPIFDKPVVRLGTDATVESFSAGATTADIVHIACHGEFRADAPLYSNLHLANGWVTVRDLLATRMRAALVTLSACETGVNMLYPGDEIMGLARGFMSAGARSLVVSLWAVNDLAASSLMPEMYRLIAGGTKPSVALGQAQVKMIASGAEIYHWAPFVFVG